MTERLLLTLVAVLLLSSCGCHEEWEPPYKSLPKASVVV